MLVTQPRLTHTPYRRAVPPPFELTTDERRELCRYLMSVRQTMRRAAAECGPDHAPAAVLAGLDRFSTAWRPFRRASVRAIVAAAMLDALQTGALDYLPSAVPCCVSCGRPGSVAA